MLKTSEFPCIFVVEKNQISSPLPLEHTRVNARVVGFATVVTVEQQYRNTFANPIDLEYLFPINHEASVVAFELRVGGQVIKSSLQEIQQAKEQFERAKSSGKRAGMLELRLENLFAVNLANVQPGEAIESVLTYQQKINYLSNEGEFIFPMGLTPKYHSPSDRYDRNDVDAPYTFDKAHIGDIEIVVEVTPGVALKGFTSPTHSINVEEVEAGKFIVELDGAVIPDHDLVLRWGFAGDAVQMPVWVEPRLEKNNNERTFMATILPPSQTVSANPSPREFVFVMDRSGSMGGEPIKQAKNAMRACLRSMDERDTFAILLFDHHMEFLANVQPVTQNAVEQVDRLLDRVDARGGTEISEALKASLSIPADPKRTRYVIFLTDGSVSGEASVMSTINQLLGNSHIFTFGIGPSVNRAFLTQLASLGKGEAEFIGAGEDIENAMLRFQDRVNFAQVTGISLQGDGGAIYDLIPNRLPDLFSDSPLVVTGKFVMAGEKPLNLLFRGMRGEETIELTVPLTVECPVEGLVSRYNAKTIIKDLLQRLDLGMVMEHDIRPQVLQLAIANDLATKYTAFVAVDENSESNRDGAMKVNVAQPMPEGLEIAEMDMPYSVGTSQMLYQSNAIPSLGEDIHAYFLNEDLPEDLFSSPPMPKMAPVRKILASGTPHPAPSPSEKWSSGTEPFSSVKEFARKQKLNGSWEDDVEITSIVLTHFVREGFTTQDGMYRRQLTKALTWLLSEVHTGKSLFIAAFALSKLWEKTQDAALRLELDELVSKLAEPRNEVEKWIGLDLQNVAIPNRPFRTILSIEDLYLAFLVDAKGTIVLEDLLDDKLGQFLGYGRG
jgi:Ca-activated chloride channel family protein